jgi:hypothetical protein
MFIQTFTRAATAASLTKALLFAGAMTIASHASAASLGYGTFRGEFAGNVNSATDVETALGASLGLTWAGGWEGVDLGGDPTFTMTIFKDADTDEPIGGTWAYAGALADLYVAVKYDGVFSIFSYDSVAAGDDGLFSSWGALTGEDMATNRNGKPYAISHIGAYIAELQTPAPVPVPPALLLLGTALASLFGFGRKRNKTATATA